MGRRVLVWLTLTCASACSTDSSWTPSTAPDARPPYDGKPVELDIDIQVSGGSVYIYAREVARACDCTYDWPPLGECRSRSDVVGCRCMPPPADCLRTVEVWQDEQLVVSHEYLLANEGGVYPLPSWDGPADRPFVLRLGGCGGEATIPIDPTTSVAPAIFDGISSDADGMTVHWHGGEGAASTAVTLANLGGQICHESFDGRARFAFLDAGQSWYVGIAPFAAVHTLTTDLGRVRLWVGPRLTDEGNAVAEPAGGH